MYQRVQVVAEELFRADRSGDRAAILAPQGLDYIVAFFGAMQAGFIAVPLPVPQWASSTSGSPARCVTATGRCADHVGCRRRDHDLRRCPTRLMRRPR